MHNKIKFMPIFSLWKWQDSCLGVSIWKMEISSVLVGPHLKWVEWRIIILIWNRVTACWRNWRWVSRFPKLYHATQELLTWFYLSGKCLMSPLWTQKYLTILCFHWLDCRYLFCWLKCFQLISIFINIF
jgi:hypothetical protein